MDGTLLNDEHQVTYNVRKTLEKVKKKGVYIVLCSGRPIVGMQKYIDELNLKEEEDYAIAFNGALVKNTNNGKVIVEISLNYDHLVELHDLSLELNTPMQYFDQTYLYSPTAWIHKYTIVEAYLNQMELKYYPVPDFPKTNPIPTIMYMNDPAKLNQTIERIPKNIIKKYAFVKGAPHFVEFTHPNATKGMAVKKLAEKLGINQKEVMAIGDNENDLSMIEYAGCGVAMENAIPTLKEAADFQTLSNNEDGVAYAIQKFVL